MKEHNILSMTFLSLLLFLCVTSSSAQDNNDAIGTEPNTYTGFSINIYRDTANNVGQLSGNAASLSFDLSAQPSGMYLLRLSDGASTRVWKILVH